MICAFSSLRGPCLTRFSQDSFEIIPRPSRYQRPDPAWLYWMPIERGIIQLFSCTDIESRKINVKRCTI